MWKDEKQCTCMFGLPKYLVTVSLFPVIVVRPKALNQNILGRC